MTMDGVPTEGDGESDLLAYLNDSEEGQALTREIFEHHARSEEDRRITEEMEDQFGD
jgi:hypothetical protein